MDPTLDLAEQFAKLFVVWKAAGEVAEATEFSKINRPLAELRDLLEDRLIDLANDLTTTLH